MTDQQERAAFDLLDQAIAACFDIDGPNDGVPVDAVLLIGVQHVEDDGARTGHVEVYPRSGAQPSYITRGLLSEARQVIDRALDVFEPDDER